MVKDRAWGFSHVKRMKKASSREEAQNEAREMAEEMLKQLTSDVVEKDWSRDIPISVVPTREVSSVESLQEFIKNEKAKNRKRDKNELLDCGMEGYCSNEGEEELTSYWVFPPQIWIFEICVVQQNDETDNNKDETASKKRRVVEFFVVGLQTNVSCDENDY